MGEDERELHWYGLVILIAMMIVWILFILGLLAWGFVESVQYIADN